MARFLLSLAAAAWVCGVGAFLVRWSRGRPAAPCEHRSLLYSASPIKTGRTVSRVSFSSGGVYMWWQVGCAKWLLDNADEDFLMTIDVHGESAGALTALLFASRADFDKAADIAIQQVEDRELFTNPMGLAFVWADIISAWLDALVPADDCTTIARLARVSVAATPLAFPPQVLELSGFAGREEAIEACMSSAHIPFFLDGRGWRLFRGQRFVDGSFWPFLSVPVGSIKTRRPLAESSVLFVNHLHDERFCKELSGVNFISLISPSSLREWMEFGRDYMAREYAAGNFSWPQQKAIE